MLRGRVQVPEENIATLHSFGYTALGRPPLAEKGDLAEQWNKTAPAPWRIGESDADLDEGFRPQAADNLFAIYNYARVTMAPPTHTAWHRTKDFAKAWEAYKHDAGAIDYADMLCLALRDVDRCPTSPAVLIIDEAQDLTPVQHALVDKWARHCERVIVAGDPAQAIFSFIGGTPEPLLAPLPAEQTRLLGQSYRLPQAVQRHAEAYLSRHSGTMMAGRTYKPREADGEVIETDARYRDPELVVALVQQYQQDGTVMVLATCNYMLDGIVAELRNQGVPFHNPYRRRAGNWNPLGSVEKGKTSLLERVRAFLRPDGWTAEQVRQWAAMLPAEHFAKRGGKKLLTEGVVSLKTGLLDMPDIEGFFSDPDVLYAISSADLKWLSRNSMTKWEKNLRYIADIAAKGGTEALDQEPACTVGTVHSVKGAQANTVILLPDVSRQGGEQMQAGQAGVDDAIRQGYVGMTRAIDRLVLCEPSPQVGKELSLW